MTSIDIRGFDLKALRDRVY